jgi:hypothetical protein
MKIIKAICSFFVIFYEAWQEALAARREYVKKYGIFGE